MDADDEPRLKEYRATRPDDAIATVSRPNVASSSVVLHLNVPQEVGYSVAENPQYESHNYEREFLNYKPAVTLPYAYTEDNKFCVRPEEVSMPAEASDHHHEETPSGDVVRDPPPAADASASPVSKTGNDAASYALRVSSVLRDFERKSQQGEWPLTTSVTCYWCSHGFEGPPIGLPVKPFVDGDGFDVTGCFCSIACAAAFNLESRDSHDAVCDRHAMLSELSRLVHGNGEIRPAPDWKSLQKFGGYMTIEQFRKFSSEKKVLLTNAPPMRSLTTQLEEVNEGNVGAGYNFVPLDPVRIERGIQELSLKRNKPRFDYRNSLDHKMNVVVHQ